MFSMLTLVGLLLVVGFFVFAAALVWLLTVSISSMSGDYDDTFKMPKEERPLNPPSWTE